MPLLTAELFTPISCPAHMSSTAPTTGVYLLANRFSSLDNVVFLGVRCHITQLWVDDSLVLGTEEVLHLYLLDEGRKGDDILLLQDTYSSF